MTSPENSVQYRTPTADEHLDLPIQCVVRNSTKHEWKPALLVGIDSRRSTEFVTVPSDTPPTKQGLAYAKQTAYKFCRIRNKQPAPITKPASAESIVDPPTPPLQGTSLDTPVLAGELSKLVALKQKLHKEKEKLNILDMVPVSEEPQTFDLDKDILAFNNTTVKARDVTRSRTYVKVCVPNHSHNEKVGVIHSVRDGRCYVKFDTVMEWFDPSELALLEVVRDYVTPTQAHIGLLVQVRDFDVQEWSDPTVLEDVLERSFNFKAKGIPDKYFTFKAKGVWWQYAKLVQPESLQKSDKPLQSHVAARFDCIDPVVLKLLAECLGFGAAKYYPYSYHHIPVDDHINHALNHINEHRRLSQETRIDSADEMHLVNALARITFALSCLAQQGKYPTTYSHPEQNK